jgi:hypothetical protein
MLAAIRRASSFVSLASGACAGRYFSDVSLVVATAKAETKKSKHYKPKVFARQRDNYGYGNALGYAQESRYGPKGLFFQ